MVKRAFKDWLSEVRFKRLKRALKKAQPLAENDGLRWDQKIATLAHSVSLKTVKPKIDAPLKGVGVLVTELYQTGGHSQCVMNFIESMHEDFDLYLFFSNLDRSQTGAPQRVATAKQMAKVDGVNFRRSHFSIHLESLFNKVVESGIEVLFCYIHMQDILATAVLSRLKEWTNIKIVFVDHASHLPVLGLSFCHKLVQGRRVDSPYRAQFDPIVIPWQSKSVDETVYFEAADLLNKRAEIGVPEASFFTLSAFMADKVFVDPELEYFQFIRNLLQKEPRLVHVIVSNLSAEQMAHITKCFVQTPQLLTRLKFLPFTPEYDLLFQSCDLFIDNFPIGSAMMHVEMMRNKGVTIFKRNSVQPKNSFENYAPKNYLYVFDEATSMLKGVTELLHDKPRREVVRSQLHTHFLATFEKAAVKSQFVELIETL